MVTLQFETSINNSPEKVWQVLWEDESYRKWTAPFMEGSYARSDWEEGSRIYFLGPDGSGMIALIEKKDPYHEMSFRHIGEIKNGTEEMKDWKDASERYFLEDTENGTLLKVVLTMDDGNADFKDYFEKTFPKALAVVKELSEN